MGSRVRLDTPYASSEYFYGSDNVLGVSAYTFYGWVGYYGTPVLGSSSEYTFDNLGRLSKVKQYQHHGYLAPPTYVTRFVYDANSNLSKIFFKENQYPEYLKAEFLSYDSADNPFYGLPFLFDLDIYQYHFNRLCKNNPTQIKFYNSFQGSPPTPSIVNYRYEYSNDGKLFKANWGAGTKYLKYNYYY